MNHELELVESMDKLSTFMEKFHKKILSGDLKNFTLRQLYYIELIHKNDDISVSEIAKMLEVKKSTVSIAVNQLIDQDIVIKAQSSADKRQYFLQLTLKGEGIMELHMQVHKNMIKEILEILNPEEADEFIKIVDKITNM
ncbi:MAG: MarR family transcriptional regulator [Methanobacteriaceae archaeon]|nr:MarR family transcriptional regulator [Methanobacteriaceae archaeon]MDP2836976.1 MarR family transcriptional regulator [Methanobacteriaceae archaeon]MDP3034852.1 MarR family transcriptional regulator [Methanobacteriaceae archaeon]MDP3485281.1 MarR family transcriptional regulator [Methanobacteriaceae archaeon]MDP3624784.1 MarR family transcriptional regulator [Methanobacteriaceae archaeon]